MNAWFKCLLLQTPPLHSAKNNSHILKHYGQCFLYRNEISPWSGCACSTFAMHSSPKMSCEFPFCSHTCRDFLEPVQQCGSSSAWGSLQYKAHTSCLPVLWTLIFTLTRKKGRVTDDLTLLWMPLSDPQLKTMLPMLRCVRKVQTQLPGLGRNDP